MALGNLAIFLIVLLLILHITGYIEVRAKTTEGFVITTSSKGIPSWFIWVFIAVAGLTIIISLR